MITNTETREVFCLSEKAMSSQVSRINKLLVEMPDEACFIGPKQFTARLILAQTGRLNILLTPEEAKVYASQLAQRRVSVSLKTNEYIFGLFAIQLELVTLAQLRRLRCVLSRKDFRDAVRLHKTLK